MKVMNSIKKLFPKKIDWVFLIIILLIFLSGFALGSLMTQSADPLAGLEGFQINSEGCPEIDMSRYMLKTECPPQPDMSQYILKSEVPKCPPCISSCNKPCKIGKCPPCPRPRCPVCPSCEQKPCPPCPDCPRTRCPQPEVHVKTEYPNHKMAGYPRPFLTKISNFSI
jgi:hypothetical protein